jgi:phosphatidylinositol-4,5-bisphosphate 3-kinase
LLDDTYLERTLHNQRLGHKFFWVLRSETRQVFHSLKFILILEAYLRAAPDHLRLLEQQKAVLNKLKSIDDCLIMQEMRGPQLGLAKRREIFAAKLERFFQAAGTDEGFVCPLEPTLRCQQRPVVAACALMRSKKMPQRIVFDNYDAGLVGEMASTPYRIAFMFKMGDDLRQDNLVLNLLQVKHLY